MFPQVLFSSSLELWKYLNLKISFIIVVLYGIRLGSFCHPKKLVYYAQAAAMFKVLKDSPPIPETLSSEGKDFLQRCFRRNPAERPTAAMLLEHRFLKNSQQVDVPSCTQALSGISLMVNINTMPCFFD